MALREPPGKRVKPEQGSKDRDEGKPEVVTRPEMCSLVPKDVDEFFGLTDSDHPLG
jgi:hypothetical protein